MDILNVNGIRAYGYTGYFSEEQVLGQWFEVDLQFWMDLSMAGHNDELTDTLNYVDVVNLVQSIIQTSKFKLIEKLAEVIAAKILDLNMVEKVKVSLIKCQPPIPGFSGEIKIEIIRPNVIEAAAED